MGSQEANDAWWGRASRVAAAKQLFVDLHSFLLNVSFLVSQAQSKWSIEGERTESATNHVKVSTISTNHASDYSAANQDTQ